MGNTSNKTSKDRSATSANAARPANFARTGGTSTFQRPAYPTQQLQATPPYNLRVQPRLPGQVPSASRVSTSNVAPQQAVSVAPKPITSNVDTQVRTYDGRIVNMESREVRSVAPAANSRAAEFLKDNRSVPLGNSTVLSPRVSASNAEDTLRVTPNYFLKETASRNSGVNLQPAPRSVTPGRTQQCNAPVPRNQTTTCEGNVQQQYQPPARQNQTTLHRGATYWRNNTCGNTRGAPRPNRNFQQQDTQNDMNRRTNYRGGPGGPRGGRGGRNSGASGLRKVGFKRLEQLAAMDPEETIMELKKDKDDFIERLESDLSDDYVIVILKVLANMCKSNFFENKREVVLAITGSTFLDRVLKYVTSLPYHNRNDKFLNKHFWNNVDDFWMNVIIICNAIIDLVPSTAIEVLPKLVQASVYNHPIFENLHTVQIDNEIKEKIELLQQKLELCEEEIERKTQATNSSHDQDEEPPNDFREIPIYPTTEEVTGHDRSFVKENITKGGYKNVDHYLDVQFRLLREDFVGSLREGICSHIEKTEKRNFNVRVYQECQLLEPYDAKGEVGVWVHFKRNTKRKPYKHEFAKRFLYGGLVCFTNDNFATLIFGKIIERNEKELQQGRVAVAFEENSQYTFRTDYVMVECNVFFEPYYHVLKALQKMNLETFPMQRYIIEVNNDILPPSYLLYNAIFKIHNRDVSVLDPLDWPHEDVLGLNHSQYRAFQAGLTKEFAIIQGPPGTGKTYLGLKIVRTLVDNETNWYNRTPILIVCYTNHALDQFLEGLLGVTNKIIRVGGQSKNENLKKYNITEVRRKSHHNPVFYTLRTELAEILRSRESWNKLLAEIQNCKSVISFSGFSKIDPDFSNSWFAKTLSYKIRDWLVPPSGIPLQFNPQQEIIPPVVTTSNNVAKDLAELLSESSEDDELDFDDFYEAEVPPKRNTFENIIDINKSYQHLGKLQTDINNLDEDEHRQKIKLTKEFNNLRAIIAFAEHCLGLGKDLQVQQKPPHADLQRPDTMPLEERWQLYFYWLELFKQYIHRKLEESSIRYQTVCRQYNEVRDMEDIQLMKEMLIVGMTTTGAARLQTSLQALKCKIVVVEEAAEVLEAHIIAAITSNCEHLILIGDHQQLRPSTASYFIEKKMNLGVSLFERMVMNELHCSTLNVQHRMRPQIADLIRPAIYTDLSDHESVIHYPPVVGVDPCLYFIDHKEHEAILTDFDTTKKNLHEAKFLVMLARHLILNGYEPEDITILAAYLGQKYEIDHLKREHLHLLQHVRVAVLDNYQGEECKIILLSLVRNNTVNSIGFLKTENRVCVALSRAKVGFYIMGNMDLLCQNSEIWPKIKDVLVRQKAVGPSLTLRCVIHQDQATEVKRPNDFNKVLEGGCQLPCEANLVCGHKCTFMCHIRNRDHQEYSCKQSCTRLLCINPSHKCRKLCFEKCGPCLYPMERTLHCGHKLTLPCHVDPNFFLCKVLVQSELPCGHKTNQKPCHVKPKDFPCPFPCETRVEPCGHQCIMTCHVADDPEHIKYKCHKPCDRYRKGCTTEDKSHVCSKLCFEECIPCEIQVDKKRSKCTHTFRVACNEDVESIVCVQRCKKMLPCDHHCKRKCSEPCGNCQEKVAKALPECGHVLMTKCCEAPNKNLCQGKCPKRLGCGHECQNRCNEPCTTECTQMVHPHVLAACNHVFDIPCYLRTSGAQPTDYELLKHCQKPCEAQLKCGHTCSGTCGNCAQGRVHQSCREKCGLILVCGHECPTPCRAACQPCTKPCIFKCVHNKCGKKCGEPCTSCKERCSRSCEHARCTNRCGEKCSIKPCTEPCSRRLKQCKHPCVGFCGEPCPPLCRICDTEELQEIFFGTEEEEDAKFVLLRDCGHVLESSSLEMWLQEKTGTDGDNNLEIGVITCPKCKTPITTTGRYTDYIKQALSDVTMVKSKLYGSDEENEERRNMLKNLMEAVKVKCETMKIAKVPFTKAAIKVEQRLKTTYNNKRQKINKILSNVLLSKIQILDYLVDILSKYTLKEVTQERCKQQVEFLLEVITGNERLSEQQIDDLQPEIRRFNRLIQLLVIVETDKFKVASKETQGVSVTRLHNSISALIFSTQAFSESVEARVNNLLQELNEKVKSAMHITQMERMQIVKAIGLTQGHWFKCPNGHVYAIGECGGAMQTSNCVDCGAQIGGAQHTLVSGNTLASEMDGARHAAWSEAANMQNYRLDHHFD